MGMMTIRKVAKTLLTPIIVILVLCLAVGLFMLPMQFPEVAGKEVYNYRGPSAKVNGETINDQEFNKTIMAVAQQVSQYGFPYSESQIRDLALNRAVQDLARDQQVRKARISVNGGEVDKLIKKYFPTEEELKGFLEQRGMTQPELKKLVKKQIEFEKFLAIKAREMKISVTKSDIDKSVKERYEQITVSHILVGLKDQSGKALRTDAEALARANEVYQKASGGSDFAKLAKEYSDDPGSKEKGGVYGPMPLGEFQSQMVKPFVDGALALKVNQISKPVKTDYGYHVIKLDALTTPKGQEYKDKYNEVKDEIAAQKTMENPKFNEWLQKIYRKANDNLEILDPGLRAFRLGQEGKWKEAASAYEKAVKRPYYKHRWTFYLDASQAYLKGNQPKEAIRILKMIPQENQDNSEYQFALANAYKADSKEKNAKEILVKFSASHPNDAEVHDKLKTMFTEWKLTDLAAKEDKIIADIQRREKEEREKYQQSLDKKQQ